MKKETKKSFLELFIIILIFLSLFVGFISFIIISGIKESSLNISEKTKESVSNYILEYLNKKYGDNDYMINEVEKYYIYSGFVESFYGYQASISSPLVSKNFKIFIKGIKIADYTIEGEDFLENYYTETTSNFLSQDFEQNFEINIDEEKIPNTLGHIPTINELEDFEAIKDMYINILATHKYDCNTLEEKIDYIVKITDSLIKNWKVDDYLKYTFIRTSFDNSFNYTVEVNKDTVCIYNYNYKEYYEFPKE